MLRRKEGWFNLIQTEDADQLITGEEWYAKPVTNMVATRSILPTWGEGCIHYQKAASTLQDGLEHCCSDHAVCCKRRHIRLHEALVATCRLDQ